MNLYLYDGPVTSFGKPITKRWRGSTYATSDKKARSNLIYQYKKKNHLQAASRVEFPSAIVMAKEDV